MQKAEKKLPECRVLSYRISISCQRITKSGTYPLKTRETTFLFQLSVKMVNKGITRATCNVVLICLFFEVIFISIMYKNILV